MLKPTLIVAIEPRCYSHAIGEVISMMHSSALEVSIVEPDELERELAALKPEVVLCSQPNHLPKTNGPHSATSNVRWVEFYPYAEEFEGQLLVDGRAVAMSRSVELEDLLGLVERLLEGREAKLQLRDS